MLHIVILNLTPLSLNLKFILVVISCALHVQSPFRSTIILSAWCLSKYSKYLVFVLFTCTDRRHLFIAIFVCVIKLSLCCQIDLLPSWFLAVLLCWRLIFCTHFFVIFAHHADRSPWLKASSLLLTTYYKNVDLTVEIFISYSPNFVMLKGPNLN